MSCGFQTGATSEHVAVYACTAYIHLRLAANLSCGIVLGGRRIAEATAEHTMDEGLAVHRHLGAVSHRTSITASQNAPYCKVRDAHRVVENRQYSCCASFGVSGESATFGNLRRRHLIIIVHLCVVFSVITVYVDGNIGASDLRQLTVTAAEYAEVRIVIVRISLLPFVCLEQLVGSHTLLYENGGSSCDVAGKVAAAVDVMRIEELSGGEELVFLVHGSLNFRLVRGFLDVSVPDVEEVLFCRPLAVPYHIDGKAVIHVAYVLVVLTAFVLRQHHVGVAENVSGGYGAACDVAIAAAEKLTSYVSGVDVYVGVAIYLS